DGGHYGIGGYMYSDRPPVRRTADPYADVRSPGGLWQLPPRVAFPYTTLFRSPPSRREHPGWKMGCGTELGGGGRGCGSRGWRSYKGSVELTRANEKATNTLHMTRPA